MNSFLIFFLNCTTIGRLFTLMQGVKVMDRDKLNRNICSVHHFVCVHDRESILFILKGGD